MGGFADLQNEDVTLDLFFQYCIKRPDLYMQFYHASTSFFSVQKDSDDLFAALSETSMTVACQFFKELPKYSVDIHTFKSLPLVPLSYSWSGSCVPLYSSWIDHLERLLPSFSGLEYLEHKKTIMDKIEHLRYAIKEEEISDIIEG